MGNSTEQVSIHQKALTMYHNAALTATKIEVATGKRKLFGCFLENLNNVPVYLHLYDADSDDVTVGTTTPTFSIPIPPQGYVDRLLAVPWKEFGTALTIAITTSKTGGTGTPDSTCLCNLNYI